MLQRSTRPRRSRRQPQSGSAPSVTTVALRAIEVNTFNANQIALPTKADVLRMHIKRNKVHQFSRNYEFNVLSMPTAVDTLGAIATSLSLLPTNTDFTALYDEYRIVQATSIWNPFGGLFAPTWTAIDYDDSTNPASINALRQYETLMVSPSGHRFERTYTPKVAVAAYSGAFTSFGNVQGMWIDSASTGVQYYGLKYALQADAANTGKWDVSVTVIVQCRSVF